MRKWWKRSAPTAGKADAPYRENSPPPPPEPTPARSEWFPDGAVAVVVGIVVAFLYWKIMP
jgi:hypothetical protein